MKIIAFGHEKNVGKDTAAGFMITHLRTTRRNIKVTKKGFADKLKDVCYTFYSWAGLQVGEFYEREGNQKLKDCILPLINRTPRDIWIDVGNRLREVDPLIHIRGITKIKDCNILFVKDLRYPNEADAILEEGGYVYKVNNNRILHTSDEADDALIGYPRWSGEIDNHTTLPDFYKTCTTLCDQLFTL